MEAIRIKPIFVPMAKQERTDGRLPAQPVQDTDTDILQRASQYIEMEKQAQEQAKQWLADADEKLLAGSKESKYLKKLGHRPLSKADVLSLVQALGDDDQKQRIDAFRQAQIDLSKRLESVSNIGLVLNQAGVNYNTYYLRKAKPSLWKADEIVAIMTVLKRLRL